MRMSASPQVEVDQLRAATERLLARIAPLTEAEARGPSALPGWTRGHVLTHIARNADAHWRMTDAALAGRLVTMYDGGRPARSRVIEEQHGRPVDVLIDDVRASAEQLHALLGGITNAEAWERLTQPGGEGTATRSVRGGIVTRFREVEVHHLDLDLGCTSADWAEAYVRADLSEVVHSLPSWAKDAPAGVSWQLRDETNDTVWVVGAEGARAGEGGATHAVRAPGHALLAWLLGRQPAVPVVVERTADEATALALPRFFPFG
jgi:maleylpyruvate isomerase